MTFQYKCVLLIGATSGIGAAMADRLVQEGVKVIAVGRRQDRLDVFVQKHGAQKAAAARFDITDKANMDSFVNDVTTTHPEIDCIFLNAGASRPIDLSRPTKTDLPAFHNEINTNFLSIVDLSTKFLPFLMDKKTETSMIFTGTHLALIPCRTLSGYSASKAALNSYIMCLRDELKGSNVKIVEIWPPVVQTELHDYAGEKGRSMGMPVGEFTDKAYAGLLSGVDQVTVGAVGEEVKFNEVVDKRRAIFEKLSEVMMAHPLV